MARAWRPGHAVSADIDETKPRWPDRTPSSGVSNVQFRALDVRAASGTPEFDVVYSRFLLTHLSDPAGAVAAFFRHLRPGGLVTVEDIDFDGAFAYPPSKAIARYCELYCAVVRRRGGDPNIGPRVPLLLEACGFEHVDVCIVQPAGMRGEVKLMNPLTMENIADAVMQDGLATREDIDEIVRSYTFAADREPIVPRVVQAGGRPCVVVAAAGPWRFTTCAGSSGCGPSSRLDAATRYRSKRLTRVVVEPSRRSGRAGPIMTPSLAVRPPPIPARATPINCRTASVLEGQRYHAASSAVADERAAPHTDPIRSAGVQNQCGCDRRRSPRCSRPSSACAACRSIRRRCRSKTMPDPDRDGSHRRSTASAKARRVSAVPTHAGGPFRRRTISGSSKWRLDYAASRRLEHGEVRRCVGNRWARGAAFAGAGAFCFRHRVATARHGPACGK
jgi:hypothetical protein